jgi:hypothetical protein
MLPQMIETLQLAALGALDEGESSNETKAITPLFVGLLQEGERVPE